MKYFCIVKVGRSTNKREEWAAQEIMNRLNNVIVDHEAPIAVVGVILDGIASRANLQYKATQKIIKDLPVELAGGCYMFQVRSGEQYLVSRAVAEVDLRPVKGEVKGGEE